MARKHENRAVLSVAGAVSGVGFSSGQAVVLFFSQTGWASWIGVCFASLVFGALCAAVCRYARKADETDSSRLCACMRDSHWSLLIKALYGILAALAAGMMLSAAGKLALLSLPFHNAFWMGAIIALMAAILLNMRGMRAVPLLGMLAAAMCACFHICLALDPRPAPIAQRYVTKARLSGSVTAALVLSVLHAALNASVAGGMVARLAGREMNPARFGAKCGGLMLIQLAAVNAAILSGGERMLSQALPTVVLAARWGTVGYYISIAVMAVGCIATLTAMLGVLISWAQRRCRT